MFDEQLAYRKLFLIRRTEEEIAARYSQEKMRTPTHLSIGQEAAAVGTMMALDDSDHVYSTHRSHAHYLAKGGSLDALIAELYGKATGAAGGWGGSMHLADESVGFMGTSAIVGSSIAIATGSALAFRLGGSHRSVLSIIGDAGPETGVFWESVSFAALHQLPLIFIVENNGYATSTALADRQPPSPMADRVDGFGLSMHHCDDTDPSAVFEAVSEALAHPPAFVEITTYRYLEHVGPNTDWDEGYRTREEVEAHMAMDPLESTKEHLLEQGLSDEISALEQEIEALIMNAFERAESAPWPRWSDNPMVDGEIVSQMAAKHTSVEAND